MMSCQPANALKIEQIYYIVIREHELNNWGTLHD